jgi:hypothetical protein
MALEKMLFAAGFSEASQMGQFIPESEPGKEGCGPPHIVVKTTV